MYRLIYSSPIGKMEIVTEEDNVVKISFITNKELENISNTASLVARKSKMENISNSPTTRARKNKMENISKGVLLDLRQNKMENISKNINANSALTIPNQQEIQLAEECQKQLEEYFEGKRRIIAVKYKLYGTAFQKRVWEELAKIPYGKTVSYKDIAIGIGKESAVRAVANAIGKNKLGILIPCHRVIGTNGKLTGFSAETDERTGLELKRELLNLEGNREWR